MQSNHLCNCQILAIAFSHRNPANQTSTTKTENSIIKMPTGADSDGYDGGKHYCFYSMVKTD